MVASSCGGAAVYLSLPAASAILGHRRGRRITLSDLAVKFDSVFADYDDVPIAKHRPRDAAIVEVSAVEAFVVFKNIVIVFPEDPGMVAGDDGIIDLEQVVRLATDRNHAPAQGHFP